MLHTLFISDLHLSEDNPQSTQAFLRFIREAAPQAEALYILGDLFDTWIGDDDIDDSFNRIIVDALRTLSDSGTRIYLMHGNRDFLIGQDFCDASSAELINDPMLIELYGIPILICHGDLLCTDDTAYQTFRREVRTTTWREQFLARSLPERKAISLQLRAQSREATRSKDSDIMDVNNQAVAESLRTHHYPNLIHGHTHRRGHHTLNVDGHSCERWVLGDWDTQENALRCDGEGIGWLHITS